MLQCPACSHSTPEGGLFCVECGMELPQNAASAADPLLGSVLLDRYRVIELLGQGSASRVYLAEQAIGHGTRRVALKVLRPGLSDETDASNLVRRFYRECDTVVRLSHPNTIRFYDFGELPDGTVFIAMEYIEGALPLSKVGVLPPERVVPIVMQVAEALHEAHTHGIIHRDLKPANVLLSVAEGRKDFVKVLDFGIAKRVKGGDMSETLTQRGVVLGTPEYMSPEQFREEPLDARADVYALAILTYELLTGALPFSADTPWEWAVQHMTVEPAPFEAHAHGAFVPEPMRRAVYRALSKNRKDRPATALQFAEELRAPEPPTTASMSYSHSGVRLPSSEPPPARRSRKVALLGAAALGASLAGVLALDAAGVIALRRSPAPPLPRLSELPAGAPRAGVSTHGSGQFFERVYRSREVADADNILGARDGLHANIRPGGALTVELAPKREVAGDGTKTPELLVHAADGNDVPYTVDISSDLRQFSTVARSKGGSVQIDLDASAEARGRSIRAVRISNESADGIVRIDAVEATLPASP